MESMQINEISLYAYCDASYSRERELWRGFLSYALPIILDCEQNEIEFNIAKAVVCSSKELSVQNVSNAKKEELIRYISMSLASEVGVETEFALAAFFDGTIQTKLHTVKIKTKKETEYDEDKLITQWLTSLAKIQENESVSENFLNQTKVWKTWISRDESFFTEEYSEVG